MSDRDRNLMVYMYLPEGEYSLTQGGGWVEAGWAMT